LLKNDAFCEVLAAQAGLKVSETSLLLKLRQVRPSLASLTDIEFLSPYCINNRSYTCLSFSPPNPLGYLTFSLSGSLMVLDGSESSLLIKILKM
jgi:hypothetical protein